MSKSKKSKIYATAYVFPGQGSQALGMGEDLFDQHQDLEAEADAILGYSIRELCLQDPNKQLGKTQFTQPALFTVNAMMYRTKSSQNWDAGDVFAGHSLGEYNALHAAGAFDFSTGLRLVKKRGEIMSRISGGGMAAIIGFSAEEVMDVFAKNGITSLDVANYNSPVQTVISGSKTDIEQIASLFNEVQGCSYVLLNTSGAFHSRYMESAQNEFRDFLQPFQFSSLQRIVISNVEARPYKSHLIHSLLAEQITHPVRWVETIQTMMGAGVEKFYEAGPGQVLTKLVNTIREQVPAITTDWPIII